ncbi:hypothetical protein GGP96_003229, partial [Salinibacter ruber]|nr:hypothetical protein [Salinibacter ruber]MCS3866366.1 hypothetical protein [Salinibacter ruber]MCS4151686.1 hypothetical protein [Salinibacter ruber]MCS4178480.1 hypothetical protein [Salinibacter ruber]
MKWIGVPSPGAEQPNDLLDDFCSRFLRERSRLSLKQLKIGRDELSGTSVACSFRAPFCELLIREPNGIRIRVRIVRHLTEHEVVPTSTTVALDFSGGVSYIWRFLSSTFCPSATMIETALAWNQELT